MGQRDIGRKRSKTLISHCYIASPRVAFTQRIQGTMHDYPGQDPEADRRRVITGPIDGEHLQVTNNAKNEYRKQCRPDPLWPTARPGGVKDYLCSEITTQFSLNHYNKVILSATALSAIMPHGYIWGIVSFPGGSINL